MIRVKHYLPNPEFAETDHCLAMSLDNIGIRQLHSLLQRALNCADPQRWPDWVALQDKLDEVMKQIGGEG